MNLSLKFSLSLQLLALLVPLTIPSASWASSDSLNPQEIVTRCFQSLANVRLSFLDPRRANINNQQSALALCDKLIDSPQINNAGVITSSSSVISQAESREIIRRFQQFHETFFKSDKYETVSFDEGLTKQLFDTANPAAYFTLATFNQNPDYSLAITEPSALSITRSDTISSKFGNLRELGSNRSLFQAYDETNQNTNGNLLIGVDRGMMFGIKKTDPNSSSNYHNGSHAPSQVAGSEWQNLYRETLGGGFMGDPSFLLLNMGYNDNQKSNGSMTLPRRWAREVMSVAFCRNGPYFGDFPTILMNDVNQATAQSPSFRGNQNCMKCHSTMDPLAMAIKNVTLEHFNKNNFSNPPAGTIRCALDNNGVCTSSESTILDFYRAPKRVKSTSILPGNNEMPDGFFWPSASSGKTNFYKSKAHGRLVFRSAFNSWLINPITFSANGSGSSQLYNLGNLIKTNIDYYHCGSLRYFEMLSGVHFEINSESLPDLPTSASNYEKMIWASLKNETTAFATHRNPKTLMKSLIRSPYFLSKSWGRKAASTTLDLTGISPNSGSTNGGTSVTISGSSLTASTTINIGNSPCTITQTTSNQITCTTAAHASGSVSVTAHSGSQSDVLPNSFTYMGPPTFSSIKQNILQTSKCINCHSGASPSGGLSFESYNSIMAASVVTPGNAETSPLYRRTFDLNQGSIMPIGGSPLSSDEKNSIRDWINAGALNN